MDAYPRAVESLRGFFAEWEAEREELQAYCSSLAFQVKSLQEENSELRAALDGIGAGVAGGRRRDAADFSSADPPAAKSPAGSAGGAREKERAGQAGGAQGGGRGPGAGPRHLDSNTDRVGEEDCEDDAVDDDEEGDSGVVSDGEERDWTCVFVSARYSKPLHGIDTAAADGAIAIASWDGTCAVFAAASASKYSQECPDDRDDTRTAASSSARTSSTLTTTPNRPSAAAPRQACDAAQLSVPRSEIKTLEYKTCGFRRTISPTLNDVLSSLVLSFELMLALALTFKPEP